MTNDQPRPARARSTGGLQPVPAHVWLAAVLGVGVAASGAPAVAQEDPAHLDSTTIVEAPETGVQLGWGWNTFEAEPVLSTCVEFEQDSEPAQTVTVAMHEVADSYEVMKRLSVSAEVSVNTIGFEVGGKAAFAKEVSVSNFASTFILEAAVSNGVTFATPVPPRSDGGEPRPSSGDRVVSTPSDDTGTGPPDALLSAIRLTPAALAIARKDLEAFKRRCGNGFVSALYNGARLNAAITIKTETQAEKEAVSTAMAGSGWGVKVQAAFGAEEGSAIGSLEKDISFFQTGGADEALPTEEATILVRLQSLAQQATKAPKLFGIAVTPYEELANWPEGDITGVQTEFEQLAAYWGAYKTLYDELQEAFDSPEDFVAAVSRRDEAGNYVARLDTAVEGEAVSEVELKADQIEALQDVQDEVLEALRRLRQNARICTAEGSDCNFDEDDYRSWYAFRAQLPLPDGFERSIDNLKDVHLGEPAKSRCALGVDTPGCISNREIRSWARRIGMLSLRLDPADADALRRKAGGEPFAIEDEEGHRGVIWYHAGDRAAVLAALREVRTSRVKP